MSEQFNSPAESPSDLVEAAYAIREKINSQRAFALQDEIYHFDKGLKQEVMSAFGSTKLLQEIAAWQALVGGTIEPEVLVTVEQKVFVEERIKFFLAELMSKLD